MNLLRFLLPTITVPPEEVEKLYKEFKKRFIQEVGVVGVDGALGMLNGEHSHKLKDLKE